MLRTLAFIFTSSSIIVIAIKIITIEINALSFTLIEIIRIIKIATVEIVAIMKIAIIVTIEKKITS